MKFLNLSHLSFIIKYIKDNIAQKDSEYHSRSHSKLEIGSGLRKALILL